MKTLNKIKIKNMNGYAGKPNLHRLLCFLCVLVCAAAVPTHTVSGWEQLRSPLRTLFVCHPAEAWDSPGLATGPEGRVSMRISTLLEIVRGQHLLLKIQFQSDTLKEMAGDSDGLVEDEPCETSLSYIEIIIGHQKNRT